MEGRVEVCLGGAWGTVCDNVWGTPDATVVCKQLGFNTTTAFAYKGAFYGRGNGSILLDDVQCTGSEGRLIECRASGRTADCRHRKDASVKCSPGDNCTHGEVRIVNGQTNREGRVEVCVNGLWGTVASDLWSSHDARVVCRQLGFSELVGIPLRNSVFGRGRGLIHFDNVLCVGDERSIFDCPLSNDTGEDFHNEDAGVRCFSDNGMCPVGSVRLAGGATPTQGRVEVCLDGTVWGTVTDDFWNDNDARVVCRQLGFSTAGSIARIRAFYGRGNGPIVLDNLFCNGREQNLFHCNFGVNTAGKSHAEDAGVQCFPKVFCSEGSVRLVGGASELEGRVEVCLDGTWGTVTDVSFNRPDALVVCRQLGHNDTRVLIRTNAFYGRGEGLPIAMDTVFCRGNETALVNCPFNRNTDNHNHGDDVGVRCFPGPVVSTTTVPVIPTSTIMVSSTPLPFSPSSSYQQPLTSTPAPPPQISTQPPAVATQPPAVATQVPPPVAVSTPALPPPPAVSTPQPATTPTPEPPSIAVNSQTAQKESVSAVLGGLTTRTFTAPLRELFREVTASVINEYCRINAESCNFVSKKRDINTRAVMVDKDNIEISGTLNTDEGNLRVNFYAAMGSQVLSGNALESAVKTGSDAYVNRGFTMVSVSTAGQPAGQSGGLATGPTLAIVVIVVIAIAVIAIVAVVIAIFWLRKRTAKNDNMAIGLVSSTSVTSDMHTDNPVFINSGVGDESKLRFENLDEEEEEDIIKETAEL